MYRSTGHNRQSILREPVGLLYWVFVLLFTILSVPFVFAGTYQPLILGVPLWFLIEILNCILLALFTVYMVQKRWSLAETILGEGKKENWKDNDRN